MFTAAAPHGHNFILNKTLPASAEPQNQNLTSEWVSSSHTEVKPLPTNTPINVLRSKNKRQQKRLREEQKAQMEDKP